MKPLLSGHPEYWTPPNNGQKLEDQKKLAYRKPLNSRQKQRTPLINGQKVQALFGLSPQKLPPNEQITSP